MTIGAGGPDRRAVGAHVRVLASQPRVPTPPPTNPVKFSSPRPPPPLPAHVCVCIDVCVRLSFAECGHHSRGQPGPSRAWIECAAAHIPHISLEQPLHLIVALFRDLRSLAVSMSEAPLFSSRG